MRSEMLDADHWRSMVRMMSSKCRGDDDVGVVSGGGSNLRLVRSRLLLVCRGPLVIRQELVVFATIVTELAAVVERAAGSDLCDTFLVSCGDVVSGNFGRLLEREFTDVAVEP